MARPTMATAGAGLAVLLLLLLLCLLPEPTSSTAIDILRLPKDVREEITRSVYGREADHHLLLAGTPESCAALLSRRHLSWSPSHIADVPPGIRLVHVSDDVASALNLTACGTRLGYLPPTPSPESSAVARLVDVDSAEELRAFARSWTQVHAVVVNDLPIPTRVYRLQGGEEVLQAHLRPTETKRVTGRPGQVLVVRAGETTAMESGAWLGGVEVEGHGTVMVSELAEESNLPAAVWALQDEVSEGLVRLREEYDLAKLQAMVEQPPTVRHFSEHGYSKMQAPTDVFDDLRSFFHQNWPDGAVREEYPIASTVLNHWESASSAVHVTRDIEKKLTQTLHPLLEEWAGTRLRLHSCYGIRVYREGAMISDHVDRLVKPSIGAIINVAQDVDEPWPLVVMDHEGRRNNITVQPGEMVFYEGSACAHSRPWPLHGRHFANIFMIFRPADLPYETDGS